MGVTTLMKREMQPDKYDKEYELLKREYTEARKAFCEASDRVRIAKRKFMSYGKDSKK